MATSSPAPRIQARPSPPQSYSSELSLAMARLIDRTPDKAAVAGAGGLGVAALAAFFLQSFHPFNVTFMDLSEHMVAVCIVVAVSTLAGDFSARRKVFHLGIVSLSNTQLFPSEEFIRLGVSPLNARKLLESLSSWPFRGNAGQ